MSIHYTNHLFVRSHGKNPRGNGRWIFAEVLPNGQPDEQNAIAVPHTMTLTKAKKWYENHLDSIGVDISHDSFDVAVLP